MGVFDGRDAFDNARKRRTSDGTCRLLSIPARLCEFQQFDKGSLIGSFRPKVGRPPLPRMEKRSSIIRSRYCLMGEYVTQMYL